MEFSEYFLVELEPANEIDHCEDEPDSPGFWWRYESYCCLGETPSQDYARVYAEKHRVVRETKASVWVDDYGTYRRIGREWGRKWAYPTKAEAFAAWKRRFRYRKLFHERETRRIAALGRLMASK